MRELTYEKDGRKLKALYFESGNEKAPLIAEIHGGAFCFGSAKDDIGLCERLVRETGYNAVALDYRLAPKHKFPAQINDCADIVGEISKDGTLDFDRSKVVLMGHSAGANLALNVAVKNKGIAALILDYPWVELAKNDRKQYKASIPDWMLKIYAGWYCPGKKRRKEKELSPVYAEEDYLSELPDTLLITCGSDSLRADGIALSEKLKESGVKHRRVEFVTARHGFIEIVSGGRMKENFYTSANEVKEQKECYEKALAEIIEFMRESI